MSVMTLQFQKKYNTWCFITADLVVLITLLQESLFLLLTIAVSLQLILL